MVADTKRQSKFKRLKRGHRDEDDTKNDRRGLEDIFSDDEEDLGDQRQYAGRSGYRGQVDEFDGFIEEDFPEDEDERIRQMEDAEVARPRDRGMGAVVDTSGLDKDALEDMEAIFGNGEDYDWALQLEYEEEDREKAEQAIELKDVFEPSQLKEKLLTDEDNQIRFNDEPERFQLDRKQFRDLELSEDEIKEEAKWIGNQIWPKTGLPSELQPPFSRAVSNVLTFLTGPTEQFEVPFIWQHRRDYLVHERKIRNSSRDGDQPEFTIKEEKLLTRDDLWKIYELDGKFRSFVLKRNALKASYEKLKTVDVQDPMVDELVPEATSMEELQDLQDYLQFRYASQLKDLAALSNGEQTRKPGSKSLLLERARRGKAAYFAKAYGITPEELAKNATNSGKRTVPDDDSQYPMDLADSLIDENFSTGDEVINAARHLYSEELFCNPRMRKHFRMSYYQAAELSCRRTEKGLRVIDEMHPFYEVKYLQNQAIAEIVHQPELFVKMMRAEAEGLIDVKLEMPRRYDFRRQLYQEFESENFSDRAEQWREERRKVMDMAYPKLEKLIARNIKDVIRNFSEDEVLRSCRQEYLRRLDQAPYKPKGFYKGTTPRVLALSNGPGDPARDPVCWVWVEEDGRVLDHGKLGNLSRDEGARKEFAALVERHRPDVIGVSGWTTTTSKLVRDLESLVTDFDLRGAEFQDPDPDVDDDRTEPLDVVVVEDETARLYKDSARAKADHPALNPIVRYCVGLARYMQDPLKEYAALGKDVISLAFHPCQKWLPQDRLAKYIEWAMVDMVNEVGVDLREAMTDTSVANLLPYIAGLGPRKATSMVKAINANGGTISTREELVGDPDAGKLPAVGVNVWNNCVSFCVLDFDTSEPLSDPLDSTRIHPEDYPIARKIAADALELDEEDIKAEEDENGRPAVVRKLFKDKQTDRIAELELDEYAEQIVRHGNKRKRATLFTISEELQNPYEELRKSFAALSPSEVFTIFTGETKRSLCEGMIVPCNVRVVKDDFAIVKLDCGIEGRIESHEISNRTSVKDLLGVGQTIRAKILEINHKDFFAKLSIREDVMRIPYKPPINFSREDWDYSLESADREDQKEKDETTGKTQRVVKHPNFKPLNSIQAEQFLGSQPLGEVIIRTSSKGNDHLAITWKVADNVYQHIDVLEMQKENEFSVGKLLRVGGKYTYSDLDELIVDHVKAMARKVEELMRHDKFQNRSRTETGKQNCERFVYKG